MAANRLGQHGSQLLHSMCCRELLCIVFLFTSTESMIRLKPSVRHSLQLTIYKQPCKCSALFPHQGVNTLNHPKRYNTGMPSNLNIPKPLQYPETMGKPNTVDHSRATG